MSGFIQKPGTTGPGGDGVLFGGSASGFTPTWVQYIDQGGNQYGDANFWRSSVDQTFYEGREFTSSSALQVITAMQSTDNFGGSGISGTVFQQASDDGQSIMGVLDLSIFSASTVVAGIIANDDSGDIANQFLVSPQSGIWIFSDAATGNTSALSMGLNGTQLSFTDGGVADWGFGANSSNAYWLSNNTGYNLPKTNPTSGDVMTYDGTMSGGRYNIKFVAGGGGLTPGGSQFDIQMKDNAGGLAADTIGNFAWNYLTHVPTFIGNDGLRVDTANATYQFGSFGGADDQYIDMQNNGLSYINMGQVFSNTTHGGGGPNGFHRQTVGYTGTGTITYTITVDAVNLQNIIYANLTGGTFQVGDTITGSVSGATGTVISDNGVDTMTVHLLTGTIFTNSDALDNGAGVTADPSGVEPKYDTFTWTDGTNTFNGVPFSQTPVNLSNNVYVYWNAISGHTLASNWVFTASEQALKRIEIIDDSVKIGDVNSDQNGDLMQMNLSYGLWDSYISAAWRLNTVGGNELMAVNTAAGFEALYMGDRTGFTNGVYSAVEVNTQQVYTKKGGATHFMLDIPNKHYVIGNTADTSSYSFEMNDMQSDAVLYMPTGGAFAVQASGAIAPHLYIDVDNNDIRLGGINTNDGHIVFDDGDKTSAWLVAQGQTYPIGFELDYDNGTVSMHGAPIEDKILTAPFNSSNGLDVNHYIVKVTGGTGPAVFTLNSAMPLGKKFIIKDMDGIASTSNITFDAGTGNIVVGNALTQTSAQTFVMTNNYQTAIIRLVDINAGVYTWMVE